MIYSLDFWPVLNKIFGNEKGSTNYDDWYGFPFFISMINIVSIFQDEQVWSSLSHLNKLVSERHFKTIKSNIQKSVNCHLYRYKYYIYLSIALIWMFYKLICKHLAYFSVCVCVWVCVWKWVFFGTVTYKICICIFLSSLSFLKTQILLSVNTITCYHRAYSWHLMQTQRQALCVNKA